MKGMLASALLGVLLALPVAAQIAGSGQRTDPDDHWYPVGAEAPVKKKPAPVKPAPPPASSPRAVPQLSGAPARGSRISPLLKVDVQVAKRLGRTSGVRIIRGSQVTLVRTGERVRPPARNTSSRRSQMKLIRVGTRPATAYTRYGIDLVEPREEIRSRPPTIRVNP